MIFTNKLFKAVLQRLCFSGWGMAGAGVALTLLGLLTARQTPVQTGLLAAMAALLIWAAQTIRRSTAKAQASDAKAQASDAKAQAALDALDARQQEMDASTQSTDAANTLMAQASGRFQELFQGLPAACVCFDKDGRIMEWNRAFEQRYTLPPVMIGASIWETVYAHEAGSEETKSRVAAAVAAVLEGQHREGIERTYRRADGTVIHLYCSIFPLRGVSGEITGAISTDIDISAQHAAEDALRRSEERMHTLYNVTSRQDLSFEEKTQELLRLGAEHFGLVIGILARGQEKRYQVIQAVSPGGIIAPGTEMAVCDTYCAEALRLSGTLSFEDAGATERRESAAYQSFGLEAYLGTPVRVSGAVWGTLGFAGRQPHPCLFTSGDRELLRLMAQWIGGEIARQQAEETIKNSEERFRLAIASISEGLIVLDADGIVTLWNSSAEQILEMTRTEIDGLRPVNPEFAAVREDGTKFPQGSYPLMASLRRGIPQHDVVMGLPRQGKAGEIQSEMLWVSVNAKPLFQTGADKPYAVVATFADISERRRSAEQITRQMAQITDHTAVLEQQKDQLEAANQQLEMLALHDSLTGLGNRRAFEQRMVQEMNQARRYGTPLSLLLLDVDAFKAYNDSFGHPAGDEILRRLAVIIRGQGRDTDFFARYGGEEFIVVLPLTDAHGAMVLAERLRTAVAKTAWPEREVTVSLGAATLLPTMPDEVALVSAADQALYAAKTAGRNCVLHALSLSETLLPSEPLMPSETLLAA